MNYVYVHVHVLHNFHPTHSSHVYMYSDFVYVLHVPTDFYGEGPLRDENGMCVAHTANTKEKRVQDALVVVTHVLSLVVMVDLHVKAFLAKKGTKSVNSTDS